MTDQFPPDQVKALMAHYARQRRQVEKQCAYCGKHFIGYRKQLFCSGRCRTAAYRERQQGQQEAAA